MSDDENSYGSHNSDNEEDTSITLKLNKKPPMKSSSKIGNSGDDAEIDDSEVDEIDTSDDDDDDEEEEEGVEDPLLKITGGANDDDEEDDAINDDDDEDSDIELDEEGEPIVKKNISESKTSKTTKPTVKKPQLILDNDDDDENDDFDDNYLQKFDNDLIKNYVNDFHPECLNHNYDEISKLTIVTRNQDGIIVDPLHRTIPYLTKYEKARVLGQRAKQIETGAKPLVKVPENIVDSYIIAELELREKKVPFIIRRPVPSGGCEYWNLKDLEQIAF
jgi:DNA-directed RNA polymerase I, II, and III subunit RPABC2